MLIRIWAFRSKSSKRFIKSVNVGCSGSRVVEDFPQGDIRSGFPIHVRLTSEEKRM